MVFSIFGERIPFCYDFDFNPLANGISLNVHEDFLESIRSKAELDGRWVREGTGAGSVRLSMPIPAVSQITESEPWAALKDAANSLALFTNAARYSYREKTSSKKSQLLAVLVMIDEKNGRRGIAGDYSSALCGWFKDGISQQDLDGVADAMRQTYYHIWGGERYGHFGVHIDSEGNLRMDVPNDVTMYVHSEHKQYVEFTSTNIPDVSTLMTLFSGLATVNGIARREIG